MLSELELSLYVFMLATFVGLEIIRKDGRLTLDRGDEIVRETLVTHAGEVVHPKVLEALGAAHAI